MDSNPRAPPTRLRDFLFRFLGDRPIDPRDSLAEAEKRLLEGVKSELLDCLQLGGFPGGNSEAHRDCSGVGVDEHPLENQRLSVIGRDPESEEVVQDLQVTLNRSLGPFFDETRDI